MLVLNMLKTLKSSSFVLLRNHFSTKISKNQDYDFYEKFKSNAKLFSKEKYKECMKYGLSLDKIQTNEWIFNMNISE